MSLLALPNTNRETSTTGHHPTIDHKVAERLLRSNYRALRDISCSTSDGEVCLMGFLSSYYLKQVAQEIASGVEGVRHVVNRIKVFPTYVDRGETLANETN
jgi:osmotically-inducible protein OsmY